MKKAIRLFRRPSNSLANKSRGLDLVPFIVIGLFLGIVALFFIFMIGWGLLTSLKSSDDFTYGQNILGWPTLDINAEYSSFDQFFKLDNYRLIFTNFKFDSLSESFYSGGELVNHTANNVGFLQMLINTVLYAGVGGLVLSIMPALTGYLCAKYNYKFSKVVFVVFTVMMCIPIVGSFPTELTFLRNIGFYDTLWGDWLKKTGGAGMYFFIFYAFFKGQSNTYREAAEIDGASELHIMLRIYFPMAVKIIGTVFLIQFVQLWNDFQTPMLYLPTHPTLSYGVFELTKTSSKMAHELQAIPVRITGCMILALPITVIFIIFKDRLMGDITFGGIKE